MKKVALGLALVLLSSSVFAKWEKIASSADGKITYYADDAKPRTAGGKTEVLTLTDYQEPQVAPGDQKYLSLKVREEFNCANETARHLDLEAYSENMGAGKVVGREKSPAKWRTVSHESLEEDMRKFACGK
jgi:hypothetical protein